MYDVKKCVLGTCEYLSQVSLAHARNDVSSRFVVSSFCLETFPFKNLKSLILLSIVFSLRCDDSFPALPEFSSALNSKNQFLCQFCLQNSSVLSQIDYRGCSLTLPLPPHSLTAVSWTTVLV